MENHEEVISESMLKSWRESGLITSQEIAFRSGDLYVAEDVITKSRRIVTPRVTESVLNKRVLKG